jgi:heterodisulfide reductase subunit A
VEAPKDVKESVTQAGAAAARASILLNAGKVKIEAITATLNQTNCNYCGLCARVCPYNAIEPPIKKEGKYPFIVEAACQGCGTCAAECPTDTIHMRHFSDKAMLSQVDAILEENPQDKIVVFACNWCSYAGGDDAGTARLQYPPTSRLIRTMCSGRVDPDFVMQAFRKGAPVVLVSGCHFSDCHYINAVRYTQRRIEKLWDKLDKLGIRPERLQLEWISAAEGQKFAVVMKAIEELRQTVTPEEIAHTVKVLNQEVATKATA